MLCGVGIVVFSLFWCSFWCCSNVWCSVRLECHFRRFVCFTIFLVHSLLVVLGWVVGRRFWHRFLWFCISFIVTSFTRRVDPGQFGCGSIHLGAGSIWWLEYGSGQIDGSSIRCDFIVGIVQRY